MLLRLEDADTVHVDKALNHFQSLVVVGQQQVIRSGQAAPQLLLRLAPAGNKQQLSELAEGLSELTRAWQDWQGLGRIDKGLARWGQELDRMDKGLVRWTRAWRD